MGMESKFIWMDGELVPFEKATIHFLTPALHYGAAVFEGIRAYNTDKGPAVFRLRDHAERLIELGGSVRIPQLTFHRRPGRQGSQGYRTRQRIQGLLHPPVALPDRRRLEPECGQRQSQPGDCHLGMG